MDGSYVNVGEFAMETSQLSPAVFHNVAESYLRSSDLSCEFSINVPLEDVVDDGGWVGLFQVGWGTLDDCLSKHTIALEDQQRRSPTNKLLLSVRLPLVESNFSSDDDEFYQFCLVNQIGEILGASCPFQLRSDKTLKDQAVDNMEWWFDLNSRNPLEEIVVDDAVLVHNKTTLLEESLAKVAEENTILKTGKEVNNEKLKHCEEVIFQLETGKADLIKQLAGQMDIRNNACAALESTQHDLATTKQQLNVAKTEICGKTQQIRDLELGMATSERLIADLADKIKKVETKNEQLISHHKKEVCALKQTIADLSITLETNSYSETMLKEQFDSEVTSFAKMYENLQVDYRTKQDELEDVIADRDSLAAAISASGQQLQNIKDEFDDERAVLECRLKDALQFGTDLGTMSDQRSVEMQTKIEELEMALSASSSERDSLRQQLEEMMLTVSSLQDERRSTQKRLETADAEAGNLRQQLDTKDKEFITLRTQSKYNTGSNHALRVACSHMQKQISHLKQRTTESYSESSSLLAGGDVDNPQQKEIDELKLRLCMGANAYRSKVLECSKLKERVNRLTSDAEGSSAQSSNADQAPQVSRSDAEIQTTSSTQTELDKVKEQYRLLNIAHDRSKSEHENVVNVLLFEIQKLAEKIEASKKDGCEKCTAIGAVVKLVDQASSSSSDVRRKSEKMMDAKTKLIDLVEKAPHHPVPTETSYHRPPVGAESVLTTQPPYNVIYPNLLDAVTSKTSTPMQQTRSVDSAIDAQHHRTVRRCGSEPVIFCPVCGKNFPQSYSDKAATEHVNSHFI